jgi:uncharacterized membrane protein
MAVPLEERVGMSAKHGKSRLGRSLAWFSVGLGVAQVAAPRRVARLIGVTEGDTARRLMRAVGAREIAAGVGILSRPKPAGWLWARVAGDAMDLALLGTAAAGARSRARVVGAMAAVAGVTVPDLLEGTRLSRVRSHEAEDGSITVRKAITVAKPAGETYDFWRRLEQLPRFMAHLESVETLGDRRSRWRAKGPAGRTVAWEAEVVEDRAGELIAWRSLPGADVENSGSVHFAPAPGGRGTEVVVELRYRPPAGGIGAAAAKLLGEDPPTQLSDDLRRFKQVLETGEVVRSEGGPAGHVFPQQLKQRPAQPLETTEPVS